MGILDSLCKDLKGQNFTWAGASVEELWLTSGVGVNKGVFSAALVFTDWLGFDDIWVESAAIGGEVGTGVCLCGDGMGVAPEAAMGGGFSTGVCICCPGTGVATEDVWVSGLTVPANSSSSSSSSSLSSPSTITEREIYKEID